MNCPTCQTPIPPAAIVSEAARINRAKVTRKTGIAPKLRPCPHCGEQFGSAALKQHKPRCPKHPVCKCGTCPDCTRRAKGRQYMRQWKAGRAKAPKKTPS